LLAELLIVLGGWHFNPRLRPTIAAPPPDAIPNTPRWGDILYTDYVFFFQAAGWCCWSP
jgi:NADH-quinone oxidoreductase subunit J